MSEEKIVVEFDYNVAQLEEIKNTVATVDRTSKEGVEEGIKVLVKARGIIQKQGKGYRDYHTAFNKQVLTSEKEFVSIIEPLEIELKDILLEMKNKEVMEARKELLQMKKDQLDLLPAIEKPSDEFILSLDDVAWVEYYNEKMVENKASIEKQAQDIRDAETAAENLKQATEKARLEGIAEAEQNIEKEKKAEIDAGIKKINDEEKRKEELEADTKYQEWLKDNNFNTDTDRTIEKDGVVKIYRLVAEFKK
jgi:hypothetical protein